jgi:glycosyltransferase involved in cell wall biosynthesis
VRVVHIFKDYFPPTTGGIEQHMNVLCRGLARHVEVAVLVPSRARRRTEEVLDGIKVFRAPEFGRYAAVPLCPTMASELRQLRPDLVHLHFPNPMGDIAYLVGTGQVPLVISYHADVIRQRSLFPFYRPLLARVFERARRVIASSEEYISSSSVLSTYLRKCSIIPYGVDLPSFSLRDGEPGEVGKRRRDHGARLVLFMGVLRPYKGLDVLLRAMTRVEAHLVIVGQGPESRATEALAVQLGLARRVTFAGEVSEVERRILLHTSDVFVLPSIDRREAFGIAQLEAMACGKPVVSSDLPTGVRFVNQNGVTGLTVPPRDPEALAAALNRLLGNEDLRARLGQAARARVEREFAAEQMIDRTLALYQDVIVGRSFRGEVTAPAPPSAPSSRR